MRIFIAGPYGDRNSKEIIAENVRRSDKIARDLMAKGHQVFCPHKMLWGWEDDRRLTRSQFLALDRTFLELWANAIYQLEGDSPGADEEMKIAKHLKLHVITTKRQEKLREVLPDSQK